MTPLTPEEILSQLRTRGFESGFQATPLREFTGRLDSISGDMVQRGEMPVKRLEVNYNFSELEVLTSTEPYEAPVAQIAIMHSNREQSGMGVFGKSVDKVINADIPEDAPPEQVNGQDYLIGKVLHMKMTPGHMMWDGRTKEEKPRDCWELIEIMDEGEPEPPPAPKPTVKGAKVTTKVVTKATPTVSATKRAIELLDGRTVEQFHQVVFSDTAIKADKANSQKIYNAIIHNEFVQPLLDAGTVTVDEAGVHHVG